MKHILIFFIKIYKKFLSPLFISGCRYTPSCSQYAAEALQKHGAIKGSFMALRRILKCNHFSKGGFDPVADNIKGEIKWLF
ncbi:MAG: membrane protein insertion efficiency factor YidD [Clostridia bacterium]|nr:membrane protein insertion efficiency factor YidD [Clostridia bacterium]